MNDKIYNCNNWAFKCPQMWENLEETSDSNIKFCSECDKNVHLCKTTEEVSEISNKLLCVAIDVEDEEDSEWTFMGVIIPDDYKDSPLTSIILEPTFNLTNDQVKFLVNVFELKENYINSRRILCNGKPHILKQNVSLELADDIAKRLKNKNIAHKIEFESD